MDCSHWGDCGDRHGDEPGRVRTAARLTQRLTQPWHTFFNGLLSEGSRRTSALTRRIGMEFLDVNQGDGAVRARETMRGEGKENHVTGYDEQQHNGIEGGEGVGGSDDGGGGGSRRQETVAVGRWGGGDPWVNGTIRW